MQHRMKNIEVAVHPSTGCTWCSPVLKCGQLHCIRRKWWHPTPVLLPGKSHGWRRLVGCSPWGHEELDTTEWLHFSISCIGEGYGTPLQCSCLENPRDGGAWWAAVYGVTQSRTQLKWLSSSSSSSKPKSSFFSCAPGSSDGKCIKNNNQGRKEREGEKKTFLGCAGQGPSVQQQTWC